MEFNDVKTIAVIGAGNMGHGIALTLGLAGYQVHLNSNTELSLQRGMDFIEADLDRLVALEMEEPARAQAALTKISTTTSLEEASRDSDVVYEAVYENLDLKADLQRPGRVLSGSDDLGKQHFNDHSQPFCRGDPAPRPGTVCPLYGAVLSVSAGGGRLHRTDLR